MMWILFIISQIALVIELYLPNGVVALTGIGAYLFSLYYAFNTLSSLLFLLFFLLSLSLSFSIIYLIISHIQRSSDNNTLLLSATQEGYQAALYDEKLIGSIGISVTDLGPSGFILVDGERVPVLSESGYIEKGVAVVIKSGQGSYFLVHKAE